MRCHTYQYRKEVVCPRHACPHWDRSVYCCREDCIQGYRSTGQKCWHNVHRPGFYSRNWGHLVPRSVLGQSLERVKHLEKHTDYTHVRSGLLTLHEQTGLYKKNIFFSFSLPLPAEGYWIVLQIPSHACCIKLFKCEGLSTFCRAVSSSSDYIYGLEMWCLYEMLGWHQMIISLPTQTQMCCSLKLPRCEGCLCILKITKNRRVSCL